MTETVQDAEKKICVVISGGVTELPLLLESCHSERSRHAQEEIKTHETTDHRAEPQGLCIGHVTPKKTGAAKAELKRRPLLVRSEAAVGTKESENLGMARLASSAGYWDRNGPSFFCLNQYKGKLGICTGPQGLHEPDSSLLHSCAANALVSPDCEIFRSTMVRQSHLPLVHGQHRMIRWRIRKSICNIEMPEIRRGPPKISF